MFVRVFVRAVFFVLSVIVLHSSNIVFEITPIPIQAVPFFPDLGLGICHTELEEKQTERARERER